MPLPANGRVKYRNMAFLSGKETALIAVADARGKLTAKCRGKHAQGPSIVSSRRGLVSRLLPAYRSGLKSTPSIYRFVGSLRHPHLHADIVAGITAPRE